MVPAQALGLRSVVLGSMLLLLTVAVTKVTDSKVVVDTIVIESSTVVVQ